MFTEQLLDRYSAKSKATRASFLIDVCKLLDDFNGDRLFDNIPGRSHNSFVQFYNRIDVKNVEKLKTKMMRCSTNLDIERDLIQ